MGTNEQLRQTYKNQIWLISCTSIYPSFNENYI